VCVAVGVGVGVGVCVCVCVCVCVHHAVHTSTFTSDRYTLAFRHAA
jgi:hypothetical protein